MAPNDSDSSDNESGSFTTTNVLLGYASKEPTEDEFSQLGGYPEWPDRTNPPSAELAKCKICHSMMTLLLQLNGDLPEKFPGHERRLYIFSCRRKACRKKEGTIRALRGIRISPTAAAKSKPPSNGVLPQAQSKDQSTPSSLGNSLFNSTFPTSTSSNQNPFSSTATPNPQAAANPLASSPNPTTSPFSTSLASKPPQLSPSPPSDLPATFAQKARITTPAPPPPPPPTKKQPWPPQSSLPKPYPSYHLDADYETLDPPDRPAASSKTAMDIVTEGSSSSKDDEKDAFESTLDKTFQKFADRLSQNPEQILRYDFGGSPLLYSKTDAVGRLFSSPPLHPFNSKIQTTTPQHALKEAEKVKEKGSSRIPHCANCGSGRVFELQLVPHAIAELEVEEGQEEGLEGMEWGTVVLGVCGRDCAQRGVGDGDGDGEVGWVEEWVGVQWEEGGDVRGGRG